MSLPVIPAANQNTQRIYQLGQQTGNNPHAFSIVGDCLSLIENLFGDYGKGSSFYELAEFQYLQETIDWFDGSFNRQSYAIGNGFNSASVLNPLQADQQHCNSGETPLACEYRIHRPAYAIITLGTDDFETKPATYEARMRRIIEYTLQQNIVPILTTKADNREGNHSFNTIIGSLAYEYDLPVWNFWLAVQPLPKHGLQPDGYHLTWGPNHLDYPYTLSLAFPVRNLTALQTLDSMRRSILGEPTIVPPPTPTFTP